MSSLATKRPFPTPIAHETYRFGIADWTDSDTSQAVNLGNALPVGAVVLGVSVEVTEVPVGTSLTNLAIDVGDSDDDDCHVDALEVFASRSAGDRLEKPGSRTAGGDSGSQLVATFTSSGANLDVLTAGQIDVCVIYQVVPSFDAD